MKIIYCALFVCNIFVVDNYQELNKIEGFDMNKYLEVIQKNQYYADNIAEYFELIQE